jgi:branched-chain amino acid transport system ATP-binding protein
MEEILGARLPVFLGLTVVLFGGAAFMTGQAMARNWRPAWQLVPYALLLGLGDRFLVYALFAGELLSPIGYLLHSLVLLAVAAFAYRVTRVHRMLAQYPWMYERAGLLSWRERAAGPSRAASGDSLE